MGKKCIILGIDPGSRITGYGILEVGESKRGQSVVYVSSGAIRINLEDSSALKLKQIFEGVSELIDAYHPNEMAIEQVFFYKNPSTALKLGQARGVAMVAASLSEIPVIEYSARRVKQSVVGYGAATKEQVQMMICRLLELTGVPSVDAADALAIAWCHAQMRKL